MENFQISKFPNSYKKFLGIMCMFLLTFSACSPFKEPTEPQKTAYETPKGHNKSFQLGRKLENPYSVENMAKAYDSLSTQPNSPLVGISSPVRTTHYYVRFLPQTPVQYDKLKADSLLVLHDYPLDYELTFTNNNQASDAWNEQNTVWQYTSVKTDYTFANGVQYEILANLYLPQQDTQLSPTLQSLRIDGEDFATTLSDKSLILTGNGNDVIREKSKKCWYPSGKIQVRDTRLQAEGLPSMIPLKGVRVQARHWFHYAFTVTDDNGDYSIECFKNPVHYRLVFQARHFDVRSGAFGQAAIDGPKIKGAWNVDIENGVDRFYAHVFRGAHRYHYGNIEDLKRPWISGCLGGWGKLKIGAYDKGNSSLGVYWSDWDCWALFRDIKIWRFNLEGVERPSDGVFGTTVHEVGHSSHFNAMNAGIQFWQVNNIIQESWATAIKWFITRMEYQELGITNYAEPTYESSVRPMFRAYQSWTPQTDMVYTPLFIDIVDRFNQQTAGFTWSSPALPNDFVQEYTLGGIESQFLKHVYGIESLRKYLKANKPSSVSDQNIDDLLISYE
jgi:hypothetical protein